MRLPITTPNLAMALLVGSANAYAAAPGHIWSKGMGANNGDAGFGIASDVSNNVIVTGQFGQCVDFGGGFQCGPSGTDMFLAKYDANGGFLFNKVFRCIPSGVGTDALGNIYAAGWLGNWPIDFGGGVLPANGINMFLVKFDASGAHIWSKRIGTTASTSRPEAFTVTSAGDIVVAGAFRGTCDFGGGPLSATAEDVFVAKYDANGNHQWSVRSGDVLSDVANGVSTDNFGNVVVTGEVGVVDFEGLDRDIFVTKYDAGGIQQWSQSFGDTLLDRGNAVGADAAGNVYVTGAFIGTVNFGGSDLVGSGDVFLAKFDAAGVHQWSNSYGSPFGDQGRAINVDAAGNVTLTGTFRGTMDLGGGPLTSASVNRTDFFVARFNTAGNHMWSFRAGGIEDEVSYDMATDGLGSTLVTGSFDGPTTDLGGGPIVITGHSQNVFIAKYDDENPLPVLINRFEATARASAVDVAWEISSDEALDAFTLYRHQGGSSVVVASGDPLTTSSFTDRSVESGKTYDYELVIRATSGELFRSASERVTVRSVTTSLGPNYPNPFNPKTTIEYAVGERMPVAIEIFDVSGARVTTLDQGVRTPGTHHAEWDGRDAEGRALGSGVYFYRMSGAPEIAPRKMILLK